MTLALKIQRKGKGRELWREKRRERRGRDGEGRERKRRRRSHEVASLGVGWNSAQRMAVIIAGGKFNRCPAGGELTTRLLFALEASEPL